MPISYVDRTDSTQDDLLDELRHDPRAWPHLSGLRAGTQAAGRGRGERPWRTDGLQALTVSFVLRPSAPLEQWGTIALRGGVAVVRALQRRGVRALIKWPNDVVVETDADEEGWHGIAKVGGILGSITRDGLGDYACVLGMGINLAGDVEVPTGTSLGLDVDPGVLVEEVRAHLEALVPDGGKGFDPIDALMGRYCHTLGKEVLVSFPHESPPREIRGRAVRVDDDGALVVDTGDAEERILSGDIAHTRLLRR